MQSCPWREAEWPLLPAASTSEASYPCYLAQGQLANPWNHINLASLAASFVNLFLYYRLHSQNHTATGRTNIDVKVQNIPLIEERTPAAVEVVTRPAIGGPPRLPIPFNVDNRMRPRGRDFYIISIS